MKVASLKCTRCGQNGLVNSYEGVVCVTCGHHPATSQPNRSIDPKVLEYFGLEDRQPGTVNQQFTINRN